MLFHLSKDIHFHKIMIFFFKFTSKSETQKLKNCSKNTCTKRERFSTTVTKIKLLQIIRKDSRNSMKILNKCGNEKDKTQEPMEISMNRE